MCKREIKRSECVAEVKETSGDRSRPENVEIEVDWEHRQTENKQEGDGTSEVERQ